MFWYVDRNKVVSRLATVSEKNPRVIIRHISTGRAEEVMVIPSPVLGVRPQISSRILQKK